MQNEKTVSMKSKKVRGSLFLYTAAAVVAIIAVASLINNILMFKNILSQYAAQGYNPSEVAKQLIPSQLLPGVFEPVAIYGGIAALLTGLGMIYKRVAKNDAEEVLLEEEPSLTEEVEAVEQAEENEDNK